MIENWMGVFSDKISCKQPVQNTNLGLLYKSVYIRNKATVSLNSLCPITRMSNFWIFTWCKPQESLSGIREKKR